MLHLAKVLNSKGIHITFFNSEHNHSCLLKSRGPTSLAGSPSFYYDTFSDGLPPWDTANQPRSSFPLMRSLELNSKELFEKLLLKLVELSSSSISGTPSVSVIIIDAILPFPLEIVPEFVDCPIVLFTPTSCSCFLGYSQFDALFHSGILPFQDDGFMTDGSLEVELDLEPASMKGMRLRDLPSYIRTTDKNSHVFEYMKQVMERCSERPIIFNTFTALDYEVLKDLSKVLFGPIFTVGPLHCLSDNSTQHELISKPNDIGSNIWKEDSHCLQWLDSQNHNSVVYVSFGSTTLMTREQLIEFAWGLANSNHPFLWVIRPDTIIGQSTTILPLEFENEVKGRGLIVSWCPQEKVLQHSSIAVFLTHCGWNSILETISSGVPVICWPFEGDHQLISWFSCYKWGIGMELDIVAKRDQVERHIREVLEEDIGRKLKMKALEWKKLAEKATSSSGSSSLEIQRFIDYVPSLQLVKNCSII
ncbi:7-deoxyloganetin glucosyltransferase-like [Silene latifolia]|uniref:7-deoxyloganetin glucosyltransferase-like n=1 Tax=Silene latifolia TaxID=37657 RepID=UPI003D778151